MPQSSIRLEKSTKKKRKNRDIFSERIVLVISLHLARRLKAAGLIWQATTNDFFAIPDRGMDDRLFVLSDMQAQLDIFRGWPVVTFHGTAEWALDYILTSEVVWMPSEEQLREAILSHLPDQAGGELQLYFKDNRYTCSIKWYGDLKTVEAASAADAYGEALLLILNNQSST
jgi:hypothetical protein